MEKDKKKVMSKNIGIVVLSIVIIGLLALCIYLLFMKKEDNNSTVNYSKIDETKGTYYIIKGKSSDLYSYFENKYEKENAKISFDYPVININTESVKKLNSDIKIMYDDLLKNIKNENDEYGCSCIKVENKYYCNEHIDQYSYSIYENKDFITLKINKTSHSDCASGISIDYLYTISKIRGKVLSDDELINTLGYNRDEINNKLSSFIKKDYETDISDELEDALNTLEIFIYDNRLVIGYDIIGDMEYALYDGNNFTEFDYTIMNSIFKK